MKSLLTLSTQASMLNQHCRRKPTNSLLSDQALLNHTLSEQPYYEALNFYAKNPNAMQDPKLA